MGFKAAACVTIFLSTWLSACGGSSSETPWPAEPENTVLGPAGEPGPAAPPAPTDVTGVVIDEEGHAVAGARVICLDRDEELAADSDASGNFRFASEAAGCSAVARFAGHVQSERVTLGAGRENRIS